VKAQRTLLVLGALAAVAIALLAVYGIAEREDGWEGRPVPVSVLPPTARAAIRAHGGGRCVEERRWIYRCQTAERAQPLEGGDSTSFWCFDVDGAQAVTVLPAARPDRSCVDALR
jgi:hypothetical protein